MIGKASPNDDINDPWYIFETKIIPYQGQGGVTKKAKVSPSSMYYMSPIFLFQEHDIWKGR